MLAPAGAQTLFVRGDGNSDGAVDLADATFVLRSVVLSTAPDPTCQDAADANDDGALNVADGVYVLLHLFGGGPPPPPPFPPGFPCGGLDPTTEDPLDCVSAVDSSEKPTAEISVVAAPAPGVRQRSRVPLLETSPGVYRVDEGVSFALLVVAESFPDFLSPASIHLADPQNPQQGNPQTLVVTADRDLGNPAAGGVAAGENLASRFLNDLDLWSDPLYLVEHAALRIAGDGPLAPAPGVYEFTARVTDEDCGTSDPVSVTVDVRSSSSPDIFVWTEDQQTYQGAPLPHDEGSGNPRMPPNQSFSLVIETRPNGRNPDTTPNSVFVLADPPIAGSTDISSLFVVDAPGRFLAWFDPAGDFPDLGNTTLTVSTPTSPDVTIPLEIELSYPTDIQPIWNTNCSGCHEAPTPFLGLEIVGPAIPPSELWKDLVNRIAAQPTPLSLTISPFRVRPYFPEQSYLMYKLLGTHELPEVGGSGDQMPADGPPFLNDASIHLIRSWIIQGAPSD